ncbi:hypothetical protein WI665_15470 [Vibrio cholerae]
MVSTLATGAQRAKRVISAQALRVGARRLDKRRMWYRRSAVSQLMLHATDDRGFLLSPAVYVLRGDGKANNGEMNDR